MVTIRQRRILYQMLAGILGMLGAAVILSTEGSISGFRLLTVSLIFGIPAFFLLKRAVDLYREPDGIEVVLMMTSGALAFLFAAVSALAIMRGLLNIVLASFIIFGAPAAVIWILNVRRRTEKLGPTA